MTPGAVVVAAPSSGAGKTTVATGLMAALRRAGHCVAGFKVGPDFIDPGYHGLATGRPGRNLDPVLVGTELIAPLYAAGAAGADIAVVEGVMGLFDGRIPAGDAPGPAIPDGSTAQVAGLIGAPIVLVVDARGQSQSLAALLHGFAGFDASVSLAGVILNQVGSARHEQVLRQACGSVGLPVLGALPRADALSVPSRHLGLVTAVEHGAAAWAAVDAMAELVAQRVDLPAVAAIAARAAGAVSAPPWSPAQHIEPVAGAPVVAVAAGAAFSFGYAEHTELLSAAGAQVVAFDPLTDALPAEAAALVLPGGFPEQHLGELSANEALRGQIRGFAGPIHAECAGLTYLMDDLDGAPMCGVLAGSARFTRRLTLGYRDAVAVADSCLRRAGERVVGHEFHRTVVEFAGEVTPAWKFRDGAGTVIADGAVRGPMSAAYLHTHPAASPAAVRRFVEAADTIPR
ncbi:cobyrinate a,c-diamide synthase [Mycolicibacterium brumae]|uniref:cobyrinate a,c-diamide synthase n=1 Tax=Mycolicibacterium brumae TaxID=85968 RepID=UPI00352007F0